MTQGRLRLLSHSRLGIVVPRTAASTLYMTKSRSNSAVDNGPDAVASSTLSTPAAKPAPIPAAASALSPTSAALILTLSVVLSTIITSMLQSLGLFPSIIAEISGTDNASIMQASNHAPFTAEESARLIELAANNTAAYLAQYECRSTYTTRILHRAPLVMLVEDFLTPGEAEHIWNLAEKRLKRSTVTEASDNYYAQSLYRTSSSAFLEADMDRVVSCVERRAANLTNVPLFQCEPLQVVHYLPSQQYKPHFDWFDRDKLTDYWAKRAGQRYATILAYMNHEGLKGGATTFPKLGIEVTPKKNAATVWFNIDVNDIEDPLTLHAGMPVEEGYKAAINIWQRKFIPGLPVRLEDSEFYNKA